MGAPRPVGGYPDENPFGVPETLQSARLRLPTGPSTVALERSATGTSSTTVPRIPALGGVEWVTADGVLWTWNDQALNELATTLASTGAKLAFVEPTAGLGVRHRLQLLAGAWLDRRRGYRFHRDVPADLRQAGLTVTTVVRFRDGIGHYVWGEARHYTHRITTR